MTSEQGPEARSGGTLPPQPPDPGAATDPGIAGEPGAATEPPTVTEPPTATDPATGQPLWAVAQRDLRTAVRNIKVRELAGGQSYRRRVALMLAAVVGATGVFGGLRTEPEPGLVLAGPGQLIEGAPWNVTIDSARVVPADSLGTIRPLNKNRHWLAVVAIVDVTADDPQLPTGFGDGKPGLLTIEGASGIEADRPDRVALTRDGATNMHLQPGVSEKVAFLWEQEDSAPTPSELRVTVYNSDRIRDSGGNWVWLNWEPHAEVTVPVQVGVAKAAASTGSGDG